MALLLCMVLVCSLMVWKASATETAEYLALGDSISAAYGLKSEKEGFVYLVSKGLGYTVANESVNGNTADGILEKLKTGEYFIEERMMIHVTVKENDEIIATYDTTNDVELLFFTNKNHI
jgi:lysophospholipase L1-like esterase